MATKAKSLPISRQEFLKKNLAKWKRSASYQRQRQAYDNFLANNGGELRVLQVWKLSEIKVRNSWND